MSRRAIDTSRDYALAWDGNGGTFFLVLDEAGRVVQFDDRCDRGAAKFPTALDALRALITAGESWPTMYGDENWTANVYARRVRWH